MVRCDRELVLPRLAPAVFHIGAPADKDAPQKLDSQDSLLGVQVGNRPRLTDVLSEAVYWRRTPAENSAQSRPPRESRVQVGVRALRRRCFVPSCFLGLPTATTVPHRRVGQPLYASGWSARSAREN